MWIEKIQYMHEIVYQHNLEMGDFYNLMKTALIYTIDIKLPHATCT